MKKYASLYAAICISLATFTACKQIADKIASNAKNRFKQASQAGALPLPPAPEFNINSIRPNRSSIAGGIQVDIIGIGFTQDAQVFFGSTPASTTTWINEYTLRTRSPAYPAPGTVGIQVRTNKGTAVLENSFVYYEPLQLVSVEPTEVSSQNGFTLTVHGAGLIENTLVKIDQQEPLSVSVLDARTLRASYAPLSQGWHRVSLSNVNGFAVLQEALFVYDPPHIDWVSPSVLLLNTPENIALSGRGFSNNSQLFLNGVALSNTPPQNLNTWNIAWPPSDTVFTEGPHTLSIQNTYGTHTYPQPIVLIDPNNTSPRVVAVYPGYLLTEGGQSFSIIATQTPNTEVTVLFDGVPNNTCTRPNPHTFRCTSPSHAEGRVEISLQYANTSIQTEAHYVDFQSTRISEDTGSVAGGTYTVAEGSGFTPHTTVFFNMRPVKDLTYVSPNTLTFRTPPNPLGNATVTFQDYGITRTYQGWYTYEDPSESAYFTYGGPIAGTVDITVISSRGTPVSQAYVQLNAVFQPDKTHTYGFTDEQGHITFSGPDILGPQSVHAVKSDHAMFSWIDINASKVTLMLDAFPPPPPDPLPDCPQNNAGANPILRGRIKRIKDAFNLGNDTVIVTTTQAQLGDNLPDPGPYSTLSSQGMYEIKARAGNMVLIALAGQYNAQQEFIPHAMGFLPFVQTSQGSGQRCLQDSDCPFLESCMPEGQQRLCTKLYTDLDITIDTPLDTPFEIRYNKPPLRSPEESVFTEAPNTTEAHLWYDFGPMGVYTVQQLSVFASESVYINMPDHLPTDIQDTPFHIRGGVSLSGSVPLSETVLHNLHHPLTSATLSPFLPTQDTLSMTALPDILVHASFTLRPFSTPDATAQTHAIYNVQTVQPCKQAMPTPRAQLLWYILSHPLSTSFDLPQFPSIAGDVNLRGGTYYWQAFSVYNPNTHIENTDLDSLFDWTSSAVNVTVFRLFD